MAASNTVSSWGTLSWSLAMICVSLSRHRDRNSSCVRAETHHRPQFRFSAQRLQAATNIVGKVLVVKMCITFKTTFHFVQRIVIHWGREGGEGAGTFVKDVEIRNKQQPLENVTVFVLHYSLHTPTWQHTNPVQMYLLVDWFEVCQDVFHAAFLQPFTGVGLRKAVDAHTVGLVHLALHETTARLPDRHDV